MPKEKKQTPPHIKPGIAKQHILDNYNTEDFHRNLGAVKNGHVLFMFYKCNKSAKKTALQLKDILPENAHVQPYHVKSLADHSIYYFKNLNNTSQKNKLCCICEEEFKNYTCTSTSNEAAGTPTFSVEFMDLHEPQPGPSESASYDPITVSPQPTPVMHAMSVTPTLTMPGTRHRMQMTPRKRKLQTRLDLVSTSKSDLQKKYKCQLKELEYKLKMPKRIKNQKFRRMDETVNKQKDKIETLKAKWQEKHLALELAETNMELADLKLKHEKLKKYHTRQRKMTIPAYKYSQLQWTLKKKKEIINTLQNENLILQDQIDDLKSKDGVPLKLDRKTYSYTTRLLVYDCIVNKVPTANIPTLITQSILRLSTNSDVTVFPKRTAAELMARELGAISELQTAETILGNAHCTIGFDATTQEGRHVNEIHFTTEKDCLCAAIDELPGGTAEDYSNHICRTVDTIAKTYCYFNNLNEESSFQDTRLALIKNISNSMSDRCPANHATIRMVNSVWKKTLNEMNCHLHPLDSIATCCRHALRKLEESWKLKGKLFGVNCMAANLVLAISKLRYKDGKGDPRGFISFLDKNALPRGIIPRYRGNRLHVLFHTAGVLVEYHETFKELFKAGSGLGGLRSSVFCDFKDDFTVTELHVLGLIGKHLTGPWMKKFYTSAEAAELDHVEGIAVIKNVINCLQDMLRDPLQILSATTDFFGEDLKLDQDSTLKYLRSVTVHNKFEEMMSSCLQAIIIVLERQYSRYFSLDVTEKLKQETVSTRLHNIDSEEMVGMFSGAQMKSRNATICFLSSRMRAIKNNTVVYVDSLTHEKKVDILKKVVKIGRIQRDRRKRTEKELKLEMIRRQSKKQQARDNAERKKIENKLKKEGLSVLKKVYPDLDYSQESRIHEILEGKVVGQFICHMWSLNMELVPYNGHIRKLFKNQEYKILYWTQEEGMDNATDTRISMHSLAVDFIFEDLVFSD